MNTSKKKIIFFTLSLFITLFIGVLIFVKNYYYIREILYPNSFDFELSKNIDKSEINVYWSTDFKNTIKIISKGKSTEEVYKEYGKNIFAIVYKNDTVGTFQYFKLNNWHGHKHMVKLTQNGNSTIEFDVEVHGPDSKRLIK